MTLRDFERVSNELIRVKEENQELNLELSGYRQAILNNKEMLGLKEENEELKKQLEEANKKLYLCTPEIPQNVHGKYVSYVDLVNEMYELKKQVEERTKMYQNAYDYSQKMEGKAIILETQQKEFIKYLEDESKEIYRDGGLRQNIFRQILQKYKEIIEKGDVR